MIYLESSALLALYLGQPGARQVQQILSSTDEVVGSQLLALEVPVVLRRAFAARALDPDSHEDLLRRFDADLRHVTLRADLDRVTALVRADGRLARCRTLDAIHVGTALLYREDARLPLTLVSLDDRVREVASTVGLGVLPGRESMSR